MSCCYCCYDEGDKVKMVLNNFTPRPVRFACTGEVQLLTGVCQLCNDGRGFYKPSTNEPCVYYFIEIQQEFNHGAFDKNRSGFNNTRRGFNNNRSGFNNNRSAFATNDSWNETEWRTIFCDEQFADFYVCDPTEPSIKIWVQGSNPGFCKRHGSKTSDYGNRGSSYFFGNSLPSGIQNIINRSQTRGMFRWSGNGGNNRYRYAERAYVVGDCISVLSRIGDGIDAYTNQPVKVATLFKPVADFFNNAHHSWTSDEMRAVEELAGTNGVVLVSDKARIAREGMNYQPPVELELASAPQAPSAHSTKPDKLASAPVFQEVPFGSKEIEGNTRNYSNV